MALESEDAEYELKCQQGEVEIVVPHHVEAVAEEEEVVEDIGADRGLLLLEEVEEEADLSVEVHDVRVHSLHDVETGLDPAATKRDKTISHASCFSFILYIVCFLIQLHGFSQLCIFHLCQNVSSVKVHFMFAMMMRV